MHQGFNGLPVDESTEPSDVIDLAVDDLRLRAMSMRHGRPRADLKRRSHPDVPFRKPMRHGCVVRPLSQSVKSSDLPHTTCSGLRPTRRRTALQLLLARQHVASPVVGRIQTIPASSPNPDLPPAVLYFTLGSPGVRISVRTEPTCSYRSH